MSYILNALRKSEQERQARQPETVTDRILVQQPGQNRRTAKWISVIILSNVLIVAGFIWYAQKTPGPSATHELPKPHPVEKTGVKHSDKPLTEIMQPLKPLAKLPESTSPTIAERVAANKPPESQLQSPTNIIKKPAAVHSSDTSSEVKKSAVNKRDTPVIPVKQSVPIKPDLAQTKEKNPESAPIRENKIPFLEELSYEFRQSIPKMTINVFVYSSEPNERFVMINMAKYKTGQQTKDAVELKEIRPESLVVNYRNQTFQIGRP